MSDATATVPVVITPTEYPNHTVTIPSNTTYNIPPNALTTAENPVAVVDSATTSH